jgi:O-methyltransferase
MLPLSRLRNLERLSAGLAGRSGAYVECGVARGGCLALMSVLAGPDRLVWGFDSFEGMPELTDEDQGSGKAWVGFRCSGTAGEAAVAATFDALGLPMDNVRLVKGWFEDSLPARVEQIGEIAILRLDCDWYRATRFSLETLYDSVIPGGVVIIDDYLTFTGCSRAVDEFRVENACGSELHITDPRGEVYWFK